MSNQRRIQEEAIKHALEDIQEGKYSSTRAAALSYGLNPRTLQRRASGGVSLFERPVNNRALTPAQEQVLLEHIQYQDTIGKPLTNRMLRATANQVLAKSGQQRVVGDDWVARFLKRNPSLHRSRSKPLATHQKGAHDTDPNSEHFQQSRENFIAPEPEPQPEPCAEAPCGAKALEEYGKHLLLEMDTARLPSDFQAKLQRYIKASTSQGYICEMLERNLAEIHRFSAAKTKRDSPPNTVAI